ncbi:WYL domain-containing protein [Streptomyces sp. NPDC002466]|uniref:WYL domain-containing protein n=1 Tax=unclassified Streptomyces TaxID=2593676 RepID=UPI00141C6BBB|nr:WYL domain-containing protein [Streptomyces sp. sk2.1]
MASTVRGRQRMWIRYERWATPYGAIRTADPCGVVLKAGRWYLVAGSVRGVRTCRVSRISERCRACRPRRSRASGRYSNRRRSVPPRSRRNPTRTAGRRWSSHRVRRTGAPGTALAGRGGGGGGAAAAGEEAEHAGRNACPVRGRIPGAAMRKAPPGPLPGAVGLFSADRCDEESSFISSAALRFRCRGCLHTRLPIE